MKKIKVKLLKEEEKKEKKYKFKFPQFGTGNLVGAEPALKASSKNDLKFLKKRDNTTDSPFSSPVKATPVATPRPTLVTPAPVVPTVQPKPAAPAGPSAPEGMNYAFPYQVINGKETHFSAPIANATDGDPCGATRQGSTSKYSHKGHDLKAAEGTPIYSIGDGKVIKVVKWDEWPKKMIERLISFKNRSKDISWRSRFTLKHKFFKRKEIQKELEDMLRLTDGLKQWKALRKFNLKYGDPGDENGFATGPIGDRQALAFLFRYYRGIKGDKRIRWPMSGRTIYIEYKAKQGTGEEIKDVTHTVGYMHLGKMAPGIKKGKTVKQGEVIAYVGTTSIFDSDPHLHFKLNDGCGFDDKGTATSNNPAKNFIPDFLGKGLPLPKPVEPNKPQAEEPKTSKFDRYIKGEHLDFGATQTIVDISLTPRKMRSKEGAPTSNKKEYRYVVQFENLESAPEGSETTGPGCRFSLIPYQIYGKPNFESTEENQINPEDESKHIYSYFIKDALLSSVKVESGKFTELVFVAAKGTSLYEAIQHQKFAIFQQPMRLLQSYVEAAENKAAVPASAPFKPTEIMIDENDNIKQVPPPKNKYTVSVMIYRRPDPTR